MPYLFGPVSSRRLGVSLGVDVIPFKRCSFDCLYCEVGRTRIKTVRTRSLIGADTIVSELAEVLKTPGLRLDYITLAGSGEPTLNAGLEDIIQGIRNITTIPLALLTNGSLFYRKEVRKMVRNVNVVLPSLDCAEETAFRLLNRPHPSLRLDKIIEGLVRLRHEISSQMWLEVLLVEGLNDQPHHIEKLIQAVDAIQPDRIQLNTVVRPPADGRARPVSQQRMEHIAKALGERAEIVVSWSRSHIQAPSGRLETHIIELLRRRPCPLEEIAESTGTNENQLKPVLEGLIQGGKISREKHNGVEFYRLG
jgi:wyosine [tRNA(Phe)-imidazoG37] synthetase (radical SAM superfamily)